MNVTQKVTKPYRRKLDIANGRVDLSHGSGGRAMAQLIADIFHHAFDNDWLRQGNDQAAFDAPPGRMVMSTDGYVVSPLFFPGGDIGSLAVHGTINDIAMAGARPLHLSASFIIEEGFPLADLHRIAQSMGKASREAGVPVITGDTKVVERGKADGVFISTAGVGVVPAGLDLSGDRARPGDAVILSGTLGDHGIAVMSKRQNLEFETQILSDSAALHGLVADIVAAAGPWLRAMRDPTRGGLAATLNELAHQSGVGFRIDEGSIPVKPEVAAACELLGLDPLYVANEGKLVAVVAPEGAAAALYGDEATSARPRRRDHRRDASPTSAGSCRWSLRSAAGASSTGCRASNCRASADRAMRILLLCHSFNSLTQRLHVELRERGHAVSVEFDINDAVTCEAVELFRPDLVIASFLKRAIPEEVWRRVRCLIVHPGIRGDRGPSALDWAILDDATRWGVTLIEAVAEMDAGPVWAWREFPMRTATKSSLYRNEVTQAAFACVLEAIARIEAGATAAPAPQARALRRCGHCAAAPTERSISSVTRANACCGSCAPPTATQARSQPCSTARCASSMPIPRPDSQASRANRLRAADRPWPSPRPTARYGSAMSRRTVRGA